MKKIKLHWGWSILTVYLVFMSIFLFYFWRSFQEQETNEMVTNDYYNKELVYEQVIDKKANADTMRLPVKIIQTPKGLKIIFPSYVKNANGQITLYKPDNSKLDRHIDLQPDENGIQIIATETLVPGRWNVSVDWKIAKVPYLIEKKIMFK